MKRHSTLIALVCLAALLVACTDNGSQIQAITPLPDATNTPLNIATNASNAVALQRPTDTPAPMATSTARPTSTPAMQPTSLLEATIAAATEAANSNDGLSNFAFITNTPSENKLPPGEARSIAMATDMAMTPAISADNLVAFEQSPVPLQFRDFYSGFSIRTGLILSDKLQSLDGKQVMIEGYVAPPLKPRLDFFVLTRLPLAFCPFCSSDVEWPDDIALVYLPEADVLSSEFPVRITGQLEIGTNVDAETGMVSVVRIYADEIDVLN